MHMVAAPLLFSLLLAADDGPNPKLPLGKEKPYISKPKLPLGKDTTYITEPLDKDGYLDYAAALNDRLGKGITPEKNANVLIWKAIGPRPEGGQPTPAEYFKWLGMDEPPEKGEYFVDIGTYLKDQLKLDKSAFQPYFDQQSEATKRPWTAKDYPQIAAWLNANEKPLAIVIEATKRPDYFNPLVSRRSEKEPSNLLGALLPGAQKCRALASALTARAMLRLGEGKVDDAWQDLLACHRLGRLVARGATMIEALLGVAIDQKAINGDLAYIERAGPNAKQVQDRVKELDALPRMPSLADKVNSGERFTFLDSAQWLRRSGLAYLEGI